MIIVMGGRYMTTLERQLKDVYEITPYNNVDGFLDDLAVMRGSLLGDVDKILILDAALDNYKDVQVKIAKLEELQNVLISEGGGFNTKVYIVTEDKGMYARVKDRMENSHQLGLGIFRENTYMLKVEKYTYKTILSVLEGEYDNRDGLVLRKKAYDQRTEAERRKEAILEVEEQSRKISEDVMNVAKLGRKHTIIEVENIDDPKVVMAIEKEKREKERLEQERLKKEKRDRRRPKEPEDLEDSGEWNFTSAILEEAIVAVEDDIAEEEEEEQEQVVKPKPVYVGDESKEDLLNNLRIAYKDLERGSSSIIRGKLENDKGIIVVTGERGSGVSGIVANMADVYAGVGKRVLILDLDIVNRTQTVYFGDYEVERMKSRSGVSRVAGWIDTQTNLDRYVVSVTSRIDILSQLREDVVEFEDNYNIADGLQSALATLKPIYDIVLVDMPIELVGDNIDTVKYVDQLILVSKGTQVAIENLFMIYFDKWMENYFGDLTPVGGRTSLILNKYQRGARDSEGYAIDGDYVRQFLRQAGAPFESINHLGEIPYYEDWEDQILQNNRKVYLDDKALYVYREIMNRMVM